MAHKLGPLFLTLHNGIYLIVRERVTKYRNFQDSYLEILNFIEGKEERDLLAGIVLTLES